MSDAAMIATDSPSRSDKVRLAAKLLLSPVFLGILLFGSAGRLAWPNGWLCLGTVSGGGLVIGLVVLAQNPVLLWRRSRKFSYQKSWDRVWVCCYAPMPLVTLVVAGLDAGRSSPSLPTALVIPGELLLVIGMTLLGAAMTANATLFHTVRIESPEVHRVVSAGAYGLVRHPYYTGLCAMMLSAPLVLGSALALVPAVLTASLVVIRTLLEDRTLQDELPGYREYTRRVKRRLLPGLW